MLPSNWSERFEFELANLYSPGHSRLNEAILYALLGPGKRLRPRLALVTALALAKEKQPDDVWQAVLPAMLAVEMVHCYSLVHDDLPAMDNDDYRRGRMSCHKKFGEAAGILVGDALLSDAFAVLSLSKSNAARQVSELSKAIGSAGMVLGQLQDLDHLSNDVNLETWLKTHALKTGKLFEASCVLGALSVSADALHVELVREYAREFGVAFQLKDDLNDNSVLVKQFGSDAVRAMCKEKAERASNIAIDLQSVNLSNVALALID